MELSEVMSSNLRPLSLRFSHSYKSVLGRAAVCLWGHVAGRGRRRQRGGAGWVDWKADGWGVSKSDQLTPSSSLWGFSLLYTASITLRLRTHTQTAHRVMFPEGEAEPLCSRYKRTRSVLCKCILIIMHLQKQPGRCLSIRCLCVSTGPWDNPVVSVSKNLKQI